MRTDRPSSHAFTPKEHTKSRLWLWNQVNRRFAGAETRNFIAVGHWFENREAVGNAGGPVEMALASLLDSYRVGDEFHELRPAFVFGGVLMPAGTMRHVVSVMRPSNAEGSRDKSKASRRKLIKAWPCSIETLSGREVVQARTVFAEATHKVEGYGNPAKRFKERDYLTGGSIGDRTLAIDSSTTFSRTESS